MGRTRKQRRDLPERVYQRHGAYYYVHATTNKWERLDADYAKAMARWASLVQKAGSVPAVTTVGELLDRYLTQVVPGKAPRTQQDNREEVRFLRAFFGDMGLAAVEPKDVADYITHRTAKTRGNREIALLSHAYNKAMLWGLATRNPCAVTGIRNAEKPRDRYVTDEEVETFKEHAPEWLKDYVDLKLLLGLRQSDLLQLSWENMTESLILVTTQKTGKRLAIVRSPDVNAVLDRLKTRSGACFQSTLGKAYTSKGFASTWQRTMAKFVSSGGTRFHEHDLRGKVATDMNDPQAAKQLLGHSKLAMTENYIKARSTDLVQPAKRSNK